jgi:hypothetical protein
MIGNLGPEELQEDETDPETPPLYYYTPGHATPTSPAASTTAPPSQEDYGATIASLRVDLVTLRSDFTSFKDLIVVQLDRCFDMIHRIIQDLAPPPPSGRSQDFFLAYSSFASKYFPS